MSSTITLFGKNVSVGTKIVFIFSLVCLLGMGYILAMVTSSILSLTAKLNAQDACTLTREQAAALAALAQQIEWALQEREAAAQDEAEFKAQVAQFEATPVLEPVNPTAAISSACTKLFPVSKSVAVTCWKT